MISEDYRICSRQGYETASHTQYFGDGKYVLAILQGQCLCVLAFRSGGLLHQDGSHRFQVLIVPFSLTFCGLLPQCNKLLLRGNSDRGMERTNVFADCDRERREKPECQDPVFSRWEEDVEKSCSEISIRGVLLFYQTSKKLFVPMYKISQASLLSKSTLEYTATLFPKGKS